jgi:hypothetical protein
MALKRIQVGFAPAQLRVLERLSAKLGLDITNTIRYCVARIAEQEQVEREKPGKSRV